MSAFESTAWSVNRPNDRDDVRTLLSTCIPPRLKLNSRPRLTASPTSTRDWSRSEKWSVHYSFVFSLTCFFRPAIRKLMAARLAQIDGLIRKQGLFQVITARTPGSSRMPFPDGCVLSTSRPDRR